MSKYDEKAREIAERHQVVKGVVYSPPTKLRADISAALQAAAEEARADEREACAKVADAHKGSAAKKRLARGQRLSKVWPEEAQAAIVDEERGEDIAAEIIARTIRERG